MTWLLDLDGVVWRHNAPIEGSVKAINRLHEAGVDVAFVTNNSMHAVDDQVAKLQAMGIPTVASNVVSAITVLTSVIGTSQRVLCSTGPAIPQALREAGNEVWRVEDFVSASRDADSIMELPEVDAVVVGGRYDLGMLELSVAARAVLQCRRLIAPNLDPMYPVANGMLVGTGSIVAAVATASGVEPVAVGKPYPPMTEEIAKRFPDAQLVVGDQLEIDGGLAQALGVPFALVNTGVGAVRTTSAPSDVPVAHSVADLATLVDLML